MKIAFYIDPGQDMRFGGWSQLGKTEGFEGCHVIDVRECRTWREAREHAEYLSGFDYAPAPWDDEPLEQPEAKIYHPGDRP